MRFYCLLWPTNCISVFFENPEKIQINIDSALTEIKNRFSSYTETVFTFCEFIASQTYQLLFRNYCYKLISRGMYR